MPPMAHSSNPSEDLTTMGCDTRRLTKLHFPKSISTAQQCFNFTTNGYQVSAEARFKKNEDINNYGQP
jgi:hypothetical protein